MNTRTTRHLRAPRRAVGIALVAVSIAACSGTSAAAPGLPGSVNTAGPIGAVAGATTGVLDVCTLMSAAQASSASGHHYTAATANNGRMCSYDTDQAPYGMYIMLTSGSDDAAWQSALATAKEDGGGDVTTISGVGDRAAASGIEFIAQARGWIVDVHGATDANGNDAGYAVSSAVAKQVIAALP